MSISETIATQYGKLRVEKKVQENRLEMTLDFHMDQECVFHWGLAHVPDGTWRLPHEEIWPENSCPYENQAVQTPISRRGSIHIELKRFEYVELSFVLCFPLRDQWDNNQGKNYRINLSETWVEEVPSEEIQDKELQNIAAEIIQKETSGNSWSLMHRYTLCHDFLDKIGNGRKGLALLFVWLRFSALRQLAWHSFTLKCQGRGELFVSC